MADVSGTGWVEEREKRRRPDGNARSEQRWGVGRKEIEDMFWVIAMRIRKIGRCSQMESGSLI